MRQPGFFQSAGPGLADWIRDVGCDPQPHRVKKTSRGTTDRSTTLARPRRPAPPFVPPAPKVAGRPKRAPRTFELRGSAISGVAREPQPNRDVARLLRAVAVIGPKRAARPNPSGASSARVSDLPLA